MRKTGTKHYLDGLLSLLLFGIFAASILSVLLTGAGVYSRLTQRDQNAYDRRTSVQYLATKVRQASSGAQVSVGTFGEGDALLLSEEIDGEPYLTRIYCCDGWLRGRTPLCRKTERKFFLPRRLLCMWNPTFCR